MTHIHLDPARLDPNPANLTPLATNFKSICLTFEIEGTINSLYYKIIFKCEKHCNNRLMPYSSLDFH